MNKGPLIVQSDHTLMLEVEHEQYSECRDFLVQFAELVKSPDYIHTYSISPLSLWNAAAVNFSLAEIEAGLQKFSKYLIPGNVLVAIGEWHSAYGKLVLYPADPGRIRLQVSDPIIREQLLRDKSLVPFWTNAADDSLYAPAGERGNLKHALIKVGYPVKDLCGYLTGDPLSLELRQLDAVGRPFQLRDYQTDAVEAFYQSGRAVGGSGVIVLPCGSGKTIIGLGVISQIANHTLIITTNNVSVHQWRDELLNKTTITSDQIGEYTGQEKIIKPITITTYQMLTHRRAITEGFAHLELFTHHNWGLIIYDEVHLLPAPVFRATIEIQARRRLGLTATLVREDNREEDVFALIGPKRYDVPWKVLEARGYIAEAYCVEYRLPLLRPEAIDYAHADKRAQFRIAAENSHKLELVKELVENHTDDHVLIIGQYLEQVAAVAKALNAPLLTGKTRPKEREVLYNDFRKGKIKLLVVSKVANFAVDLPDANVLIEISGMFGSRQEEAQRLGRILRPKERPSFFYALVSKGTSEQEFAVNRQMFLVEQGYKYQIRYFE